MKKLTTPLDENTVRSLRLGDNVTITGIIYTARDAAHQYLCSPNPDFRKLPPRDAFKGALLYHCGPVTIQKPDGSWEVTAAGPTTSIREEVYEAQVIHDYGIRAIIGKGGMGPKTLQACQEYGCVYLSAVGGAAQVLANAIKKVRGVYMYDTFGAPEAIWELEVEEFPLIVTMDTQGHSLHQQVQENSAKILASLPV